MENVNRKLLEKVMVDETYTIKETMRQIDEGGLGTAFVVDKERKLLGVTTDGDIRRAILKGISIEKSIKEIMIKDPVTVDHVLTDAEAEELLREENIKRKIPYLGSLKIPVLDNEGKVKGIVFLYEKGPKKVFIVRSPSRTKAIKRVLVVGGAGYLGSILCRKLLTRGYKVIVLDNLIYGDDGIKELYDEQNFDFINGDMRNLQTIIKAAKGADAVIHLAAIVGDPASALNPEETVEINYLATKMLAEVCKYSQINRFIFASTCSVYGANPKPEIKLGEDSSVNPVSLYAEMKLKSEQAILELVDENFSPTILRMATLYGLSPRMRFDLVINLLTAKAVVDKEITIFGGEQWRPNLHVKDAAEAYIKCLEAPITKIRGEIFNVGSDDQNYQIKEIGEIVGKIIPEAEIITDERTIDSRNYNVSFDKIAKTLNYSSEYTIKDGVTEIRDAIENGLFEDYTHEKYSNYKYLQQEKKKRGE